ncbi:Nitric oxide -responding transcriptional regulator Dnr (Crp/Fnr family) [hydrothermal vent metagenome]|uniref:Nitric oxide -responding transcriptional regulator Dnr (Crp/Fnr family) n=1 Tax=hydrothermal vent metagenome TaxID=652676 RepID=A0A3B1BQS1_9ZZZZ
MTGLKHVGSGGYSMKSEQLLAAELKDVYLFEMLDEKQNAKILQSSTLINLAGRETLFEAGQAAQRFYLLKSGQIKLYCISADGDEKVMEIVHPSQTFAEAIIFMHKHVYPLSAEAINKSEVISFSMQTFKEILEQSTETCFRLMAGMSRRLHARIYEINNLTLHNATYRLVVFLLDQLPSEALELSHIHLTTPKSVVASRLAIQPETFSRILTRLSRTGLIDVDGNDITLLNVEGLRALL